MPEPIDNNDDGRIFALFDNFCKVVLKNTSRNIRRRMANRNKREVIQDVSQYLYETTYNDVYPSDRFFLSVGEFNASVGDETVYMALLALPDRQLTVLILDFRYDWLDEDIANYLEVTTRTVYNLRQRAFMAIRRFYEEGQQKS